MGMLIFYRRAKVPGPPIPRFLVILFRFFFCNPTDRPTQYQEIHSTLNKNKRGMAFNSKVKKYNVKTKLNGASVSQRKRRLLKKLKATLSFDRILEFVPRQTSYLKGQKGKRKRYAFLG